MNFIYKFTFPLCISSLQSYLIKNFHRSLIYCSILPAWRHQIAGIPFHPFTLSFASFPRYIKMFALFSSPEIPSCQHPPICLVYVVDIINFHIWLKSLVSSAQIELWKFLSCRYSPLLHIILRYLLGNPRRRRKV